MAKEGMTLEEIKKSIRKIPDKLEYLEKIIKKEKVLNPQTRRNVNLLLADKYIEEDVFNNGFRAILAYENAEATKEQWTELGKKLEKKNDFSNALGAYEKAGLTNEQLNKVGERYAKNRMNGGINIAQSIYEKAGATKEQWRALGDANIERGVLVRAEECYEHAGKKLSNEQLIKIGNKYIERGHLGNAIESYEKAGQFEKANELSVQLREKYGNLEKVENQKPKSKKDLWARLGITTSIIVLLGGLFFLSSNVTGNVVENMTNSTSNWIGGILFVLGLVGALFYFKKK